MMPILKIAHLIGLGKRDLELFGDYKAKIKLAVRDKFPRRENAALILVSAMTPTPAGEGKTTVSIGLAQALAQLGKKTIVTLRSPRWDPYSGAKAVPRGVEGLPCFPPKK